MLEDLWKSHGEVILFAAFALCAVAIPYLIRRERERKQAVGRTLAMLGFSPIADMGKSIISEYSDFALFSRGRSKKARIAHRSSAEGGNAVFMEYSYKTGGGKNSITHTQSVLVFDIPALTFPPFSLMPENIVLKIFQTFGYQDIDFENHPVFSSQYVLRGKDESALRNLFTSAKITFFENRPGITIEGAGNKLLFYVPRKLMKADGLDGFVRNGREIVRQFLS